MQDICISKPCINNLFISLCGYLNIGTFILELHHQLQEGYNEFGVEYSTSVWDVTSAREICTLYPNLIKVPSACNLNKGLLEYLCDNFGGEIHLSFGMTTREEEERIIRFFESKGRNKDLVIYDCTSVIPYLSRISACSKSRVCVNCMRTV